MRMGQGVRTGLGHGGITCALQTQFSSFYAPNFEEVEGAYWFGPVRLTVCPSVSPLHLLLVVKLENRLS